MGSTAPWSSWKLGTRRNEQRTAASALNFLLLGTKHEYPIGRAEQDQHIDTTVWSLDPADPQHNLAMRLVQADSALLDQLIDLRRQQGLTQADVGARMGIGQSAVARIEGSERDPHLSPLRRYALALGAMVEHTATLDIPLGRQARQQNAVS